MNRVSLENTIYVEFGRQTWLNITWKIIFSLFEWSCFQLPLDAGGGYKKHLIET